MKAAWRVVSMPSEHFKTPDLGQAAYLAASGFPLVTTEGRPRRVFVFPQAARDIADSYFDGARVVAQDFAVALRTIKAKLYSG